MEHLYKYASEFTLVEPDEYMTEGVYLKKMNQRGGGVLWAVFLSGHSSCLSADGKYFMIQPMPSNRDEAFLKEARFLSPEAAINAFKLFLKSGHYNPRAIEEFRKRFPKDL